MKSRTCLLSVIRLQHDKPRFDVVALGYNWLLPRQSSKPSAHVGALPAGPRRSALPACRLMPARAGSSSKVSFQRSVKMCPQHKAKDMDGLDLGERRNVQFLQGVCSGASPRASDDSHGRDQTEDNYLKPQSFCG